MPSLAKKAAAEAAFEARLNDISENLDSYTSAEQIPLVIDDDVPDDEDQGDIDWVDLTGDDDAPPPPLDNRFVRNPPVPQAWFTRAVQRMNMWLHVGDFVELVDLNGRYKYEFLEVKKIWKYPKSVQYNVRGIAYTRCRYLRGFLPKKCNEVCRIVEIDDNDPRPVEEQALVELPMYEVMVIRKLRTTNMLFPESSCAIEDYDSQEDATIKGPLVCRWVLELRYKNGHQRLSGKPYDSSLRHISESDDFDESDPPRVKECYKLERFRSGKVRGGSSLSAGRDLAQPSVDLDGTDDVGPSPLLGQCYSATDLFCGAGGASEGMRQAGIRIHSAVEHWTPAVLTYRANHPTVQLMDMNMFDYLSLPEHKIVDCLHLSPPCQYFSPAHTRPGKNDELNMFALFSCVTAIEKLKPRVFTLEQTFGILHEQHLPFFHALIHGFTSRGYSVRWSVVHLKTWGLPQPRKRLIIIGSCPGEKLPDFPAPSHGPGLKPYVTVEEVFRRIPRGAQLHDVRTARRFSRPAWDARSLFPFTITCGGANGTCHPSGARTLTKREIASLQGFPHVYRFESSSVVQQIGNAFPPVAVRHLYNHLRQHLLKSDGMVDRLGGNATVPMVIADPADDTMVIDDDNDEELAIVIDKDEEDVKPIIIHEDEEDVKPIVRNDDNQDQKPAITQDDAYDDEEDLLHIGAALQDYGAPRVIITIDDDDVFDKEDEFDSGRSGRESTVTLPGDENVPQGGYHDTGIV